MFFHTCYTRSENFNSGYKKKILVLGIYVLHTLQSGLFFVNFCNRYLNYSGMLI